MRPLAALERFFEQLFERPSVRLFRPRIQPVQLQRRIERAMETERMSGANRTLVPNRFHVRLHPDDLAAFGELTTTLATELANGALGFARAHRYTVVDRPRVDLIADPGVGQGEIRVAARFAERPADAAAVAVPTTGSWVGMDGGDGPDGGPERSDPELVSPTMVFKVPTVDGPLARLTEIRPNGTQREIALGGGPLTIGRATDNGLVIQDSRVSRHHARLQARRGTLVYSDLGSTNGSRVNGAPVAEVVLGEGDRIEVGDTVLVVESIPGG
jgi:hypothetical protein